jgi:hypothetical protein
MRGRKPLPNVVKLLRASRRPLNPDEPVLPRAAIEPPATLHEAARGVWDEVVPHLAPLGILTTADVGRVARTCEVEALGRRWLTQARQAPRKDARGMFLLAVHAFTLADKVWNGYGVGAPGERARLRTPPKEEDELASFRAKHRA